MTCGSKSGICAQSGMLLCWQFITNFENVNGFLLFFFGKFVIKVIVNGPAFPKKPLLSWGPFRHLSEQPMFVFCIQDHIDVCCL